MSPARSTTSGSSSSKRWQKESTCAIDRKSRWMSVAQTTFMVPTGVAPEPLREPAEILLPRRLVGDDRDSTISQHEAEAPDATEERDDLGRVSRPTADAWPGPRWRGRARAPPACYIPSCAGHRAAWARPGPPAPSRRVRSAGRPRLLRRRAAGAAPGGAGRDEPAGGAPRRSRAAAGPAVHQGPRRSRDGPRPEPARG